MSVEDISRGLEILSNRLSQDQCAPDPDRDDWGDVRSTLDELYRVATRQILPNVNAAMAELDPESGMRARQSIAHAISQAAAVLHAAEDHRAEELLRRAIPLAEGDDFAPAMRDAERHMTDFTWLNFAFWSLNNGLESDVDRGVRKALSSKGSAIAAVARDLKQRPRALASPPALGSLNGIGVSVYGARDHIEDTYVMTRYFIIIFVPIFAIDAFRVRKAPGDGWYFLAKVPLGPFAIWWRRILALLLVVGIGNAVFQSTYNSPASRAERAIAEAEAAPDPLAAQRALFEQMPLHEHRHLRRAAANVMTLTLAAAPETVTPADAATVEGVVRQFDSLTLSAVTDTMRRQLGTRLLEWAKTQDITDPTQAAFAHGLMADASRVGGAAIKSEISALRDSHLRAQAAQMAAEWPLDALRLYAQASLLVDVLPAAEAIAAGLPAESSAWREMLPELTLLQKTGRNTGKDIPALTAAYATATSPAALTDAQQALLANPKVAPLAAEVEKTPHDQRLVVGYAQALIAEGKLDAARAAIEALGPPGALGATPRQLMASLLVEAGQAEAGDRMLSHHLRGRRAGYEKARDAFMNAAKRVEDRYINAARRGHLPPDIDRTLTGKSEKEQQELFSAWLGEKLKSDPSVKAARETWFTYGDVVPMALQLGTIKLQRAQGAQGEAQAALLTQAEQTLLSIQAEAGGTPEYHLQLGQVYYRTGKREAGEAEFAQVLANAAPELKAQVARAYRYLGEDSRSRAILIELVETARDPTKTAAAMALTAMADSLDDREKWIAMATADNPAVRVQQLQVKADRHLADGDFKAADAVLVKVIEIFRANAENDSASANNAANAEVDRFTCTGDLRRLQAATEFMEGALRQAPDNPVIAANAAAIYMNLATVELLKPYLPATLVLPGGVHNEILRALLAGPEQAALLAHATRSARLRRALSLSDRVLALAPGSVRAYTIPMTWAMRFDREDMLSRLARRGADAQLDTGSNASDRLFTEAKEFGPTDAKVFDTMRAQFEAISTRTKQGRAVRHMLIAQLLKGRAEAEGKAELAREAVKVAMAARAEWPALVSDTVLARYVLRQAALELIDATPALKEGWTKMRWMGETSYLWSRAKTSPAVVQACRNHPTLKRAAALRREVAQTPSIAAWMVGRLTNDAATQAAHRGVFTRKNTAHETALAVQLNPNDSSRLIAEILAAGADQPDF